MAAKKGSNTSFIGGRSEYACRLIHILHTLFLDEISSGRNDRDRYLYVAYRISIVITRL